ncbi:MAG: SRPBCC domain-containing protein [Proteobacteria bacterium]|nr:MAG: SRPBCC domain-containing protein [Pseudomonadota bacterium]
MSDITHSLGIQAPIAEVYKALSTIDGLSRWWTSDTTGESVPGKEIKFNFLSLDKVLRGSITMRVENLEKDKLVKWRCVDGPPEWIGHEFFFELSYKGTETMVKFSHRGWREVVDFTYHCSMKWATYLLSLRDLVTTGKGRPNPHDLKIEADD